MERFSFNKLNEVDETDQYQVEMSHKFTYFENLRKKTWILIDVGKL
jgi:hypothetical protein